MIEVFCSLKKLLGLGGEEGRGFFLPELWEAGEVGRGGETYITLPTL